MTICWLSEKGSTMRCYQIHQEKTELFELKEKYVSHKWSLNSCYNWRLTKIYFLTEQARTIVFTILVCFKNTVFVFVFFCFFCFLFFVFLLFVFLFYVFLFYVFLIYVFLSFVFLFFKNEYDTKGACQIQFGGIFPPKGYSLTSLRTIFLEFGGIGGTHPLPDRPPLWPGKISPKRAKMTFLKNKIR